MVMAVVVVVVLAGFGPGLFVGFLWVRVGVLVLGVGVLGLLLFVLWLVLLLFEEGESELRPLMVTSSSRLLLELVSKRRALMHELLMGVLERFMFVDPLMLLLLLLFIRSEISFFFLESVLKKRYYFIISARSRVAQLLFLKAIAITILF